MPEDLSMAGGAVDLVTNQVEVPTADPRRIQCKINPLFAPPESSLGAFVQRDFRLQSVHRLGQFLGPHLDATIQFVVCFAQLIALLALGVCHQTDERRDPDQKDQTARIDAGQREAGSRQQWNANHDDQACHYAGPVTARPSCYKYSQQEKQYVRKINILRHEPSYTHLYADGNCQRAEWHKIPNHWTRLI